MSVLVLALAVLALAGSCGVLSSILARIRSEELRRKAAIAPDQKMDPAADSAAAWEKQGVSSFEVWKYYGGVGGADKDTMIKISTWLLGFSTVIIGLFGSGKLPLRTPAILAVTLGAVLSILAAFVALLYGGYAAWNWAIADRIAEDRKWEVQKPEYDPIRELHWTAGLSLRLAKPTVTGVAPVFWVFFSTSLVFFGAHVALLYQLACTDMYRAEQRTTAPAIQAEKPAPDSRP